MYLDIGPDAVAFPSADVAVADFHVSAVLLQFWGQRVVPTIRIAHHLSYP